MKKSKIIVILGPTSVGKTSLSIKIAKKFNGEIISADSRQVYKNLDIGTGKITKDEMDGVPHYLIDIRNPEESFSAQEFKKLAEERIEEILSRGKLPIIVGGTGFYIQSIVEGVAPPEVPPDEKLRKELENKTFEELVKKLEETSKNPVTSIYRSNKRRLIRAIEVVEALGEIPPIKKSPKYNVLQVGLDLPDEELKDKIEKRINEWVGEGLVEEGKKLQKSITPERFNELGLEYRLLGQFLRDKIGEKEMIKRMNIETFQYVKRQRTWFKRDEKIKWFEPSQEKKVFEEIREFLT